MSILIGVAKKKKGMNSTRIVTTVQAAFSNKYKNLRQKILKSNVKKLCLSGRSTFVNMEENI